MTRYSYTPVEIKFILFFFYQDFISYPYNLLRMNSRSFINNTKNMSTHIENILLGNKTFESVSTNPNFVPWQD